MFSSVLIANRGEIACRIARSAKALGLRTIAVYSDADARALHVRLCDEAHHIGPSPARESYLAIDRLIAVGRRASADCVHPGYGFLAENAAFAEAVAAAGMVFVGPPPAAIRAMGLKDAAKSLMERAGVPVVPGYHGERQDPRFLKQKAYEIGCPLLIKPIAGGGGKGMRRVERHADFDEALEGAMREALSAFGDTRVLIEKYVTSPRHIEIQVFADTHGNVIHLNERDCSLQRRHQKVIEEAPAPGMTAALRATMGEAAKAAAKAVGYAGAGTVEFIADGANGLRADRFWFLEMNTRLQVEHPVTEAITGLDLVAWQFRIAAGERLPLVQEAVPLDGHAVEARLYAEDPAHGFMPSTGRLAALELPSGDGVRVDSGVEAGMEVTPFYDPMIAKIIAHAAEREAALSGLANALERTVVAGPRTNAAFLAALCRAPAFRAGEFDTGFIDRNLAELAPASQPLDEEAVAFGALALLREQIRRLAISEQDTTGDAIDGPWSSRHADGFTLGAPWRRRWTLLVDGEMMTADVRWTPAGPEIRVGAHRVARLPSDRRTAPGSPWEDYLLSAPEESYPAGLHVVATADCIYAIRAGRQITIRAADHGAIDAGHLGADGIVRAPMHGKLLALFVDKGAPVDKGHRVAVIEAMKMEHTLTAPMAGIVTDIGAAVGQQVAEGARIMVIEAPNKTA